MKIFLMFTGSGPLVIATSHESIECPELNEKFAAKGIFKYIAHELPLELVKERYHGHFEVASHNLHETDDLRVIDYNGERVFRLFSFDEFGPEIMHEPDDYTAQFNYPHKK